MSETRRSLRGKRTREARARAEKAIETRRAHVAHTSPEERRIEAVKLMEQGYSERAAAKKAGTSAYRLRKYGRRLEVFEPTEPGKRKRVKGDVIREHYTFVRDVDTPVTVHLNKTQASRNGRYLNAARKAVKDKSAKPLKDFQGMPPLVDVEGNEYVWETRLSHLQKLATDRDRMTPYKLVK